MRHDRRGYDALQNSNRVTRKEDVSMSAKPKKNGNKEPQAISTHAETGEVLPGTRLSFSQSSRFESWRSSPCATRRKSNGRNSANKPLTSKTSRNFIRSSRNSAAPLRRSPVKALICVGIEDESAFEFEARLG